jgi:EAL domain-containing protein (putative c-di-GMP-specific phosphodiesterase class I)/AmiR/NasT family two-component response regulator
MAVDHQARALIIDDESYMRQIIKLLLTEFGLKDVVLAANGEEALEKLDKEPCGFDLLFCDLKMPRIDGIELLRLIAKRKFKGDIVIISACNQKTIDAVKNIAASYELNLLGALTKPISFSSLNAMLNKTQERLQQKTFNAPRINQYELKKAIQDKELSLYYQPQVNVNSGQVESMEALIRWKMPSGEVVIPDHFIPLAESSGLIGEISEFVLINGFKQLAVWNKQGLNLTLSLNISTFDLKDTEFPNRLIELANKYEIEPEQVLLEVTESRIAENERIAVEVLTRIQMHGFKLAIDDFGTGYSSLAQLTKIPFSELKLDYSFVSRVMTDNSSEVIVDSSIEIANRLGLQVVAEGVESNSAWQVMQRKGVQKIQGYYLSKPMAKDKVFNWINTYNNKQLIV